LIELFKAGLPGLKAMTLCASLLIYSRRLWELCLSGALQMPNLVDWLDLILAKLEPHCTERTRTAYASEMVTASGSPSGTATTRTVIAMMKKWTKSWM